MSSKTVLNSSGVPYTPFDKKGSEYCEVCRRDTGTTVCAVCLKCASGIIRDRRHRFSRSEGEVYMRNRFGSAFKHNFTPANPRPVSEKVSVRVGEAGSNA
jgi:hypothetical protein